MPHRSAAQPQGAAAAGELGKCYEQAIKERALSVLANIDAELCAQVSAGLDLPAPAVKARLTDPAPSPALSQLGQTWPLDGRIIGIVADETADLEGVRVIRQAVLDAKIVPLLIAPVDGQLDPDGTPITVQRSFATARSVEFDAIVLGGTAGPGSDATGARDGKAGDSAATTQQVVADPRAVLLVNEAFRHGKAIGAWSGGDRAITAAGVPADAPGVLIGSTGDAVLDGVTELLGAHRVWKRFTPQTRTRPSMPVTRPQGHRPGLTHQSSRRDNHRADNPKSDVAASGAAPFYGGSP
ncbi:catalase-related domain-containing protein [Streptomyces rubiginosohelvolus]